MADPTLSPQQAAQALSELAGFEDDLNRRVGALTGMVWGVVSAAIFVSYGMAEHISPGWVLGLLWLPWTVAGMVITLAAWKLHAVTMRREATDDRSWVWGLVFTAVFLAAIALLYVLDLQQRAFSFMLVVNGLVAFLIVVMTSRQAGRLVARPMIVAGVLLVIGAFALGTLELSDVAMGFASAGLVGVTYVGAGLLGFVRG